MQDGDVSDTWADISGLENELTYTPKTSVKEGVANFINWYKNFYNVDENVKTSIGVNESGKYAIMDSEA